MTVKRTGFFICSLLLANIANFILACLCKHVLLISVSCMLATSAGQSIHPVDKKYQICKPAQFYTDNQEKK